MVTGVPSAKSLAKKAVIKNSDDSLTVSTLRGMVAVAVVLPAGIVTVPNGYCSPFGPVQVVAVPKSAPVATFTVSKVSSSLMKP